MISRYRSSSAKSEHLLHFCQARHQSVYFLGCVVDVEARSRCSRYVQLLHQELAAMVADPDSDTLVIEDRTDVMRVDLTEVERHHAAPTHGVPRPVDLDVGNAPD